MDTEMAPPPGLLDNLHMDFPSLNCEGPDGMIMPLEELEAALAGLESGKLCMPPVEALCNELNLFTSTSSMEVQAEPDAMSVSFDEQGNLRQDGTEPVPMSIASQSTANCDNNLNNDTNMLRKMEDFHAFYTALTSQNADSNLPLEEFGVLCEATTAAVDGTIAATQPTSLQEEMAMNFGQFYLDYCASYGQDTSSISAPVSFAETSGSSSSSTASWLDQTYPCVGLLSGQPEASASTFEPQDEKFYEADPFRYVPPEGQGIAVDSSTSQIVNQPCESFFVDEPQTIGEGTRVFNPEVFNPEASKPDASNPQEPTFAEAAFGDFLRAPFASRPTDYRKLISELETSAEKDSSTEKEMSAEKESSAEMETSTDTVSSSLGLDIGPFDNGVHVDCDCQKCHLMRVALTKDFDAPHPMEPWLAGFGFGDPIDSDSDLYALQDMIKS